MELVSASMEGDNQQDLTLSSRFQVIHLPSGSFVLSIFVAAMVQSAVRILQVGPPDVNPHAVQFHLKTDEQVDTSSDLPTKFLPV